MLRVVLLAAALVLPRLAWADIDAGPSADGELTSVELQPVSASACEDTIAWLDPHHEASPALACKKLDQLKVPGLGTVELHRIDVALGSGFAIVVVLRRDDNIEFRPLAFTSGGCATGTCVDHTFRRAHLVRLDPKDPTFGVEVDDDLIVSHTFKDMGPGYTSHAFYRLACASRARVLDCKEIVVGGRGTDCRVLGWHGTAVRYECAGETLLVPSRPDDMEGVPQIDADRVQKLDGQIDRVIAENQRDCADLVKQLDRLIDRERDGFALRRSLYSGGKLPARFEKSILNSINRMSGAHTCLSDPAVQQALGRLWTALGYPVKASTSPRP
jgi:hypothetical protein